MLGRTKGSFMPCARKIGTPGGSVPGVLAASNAFHGATSAILFTLRKLRSSARDGPRRIRTSKNLSIHSPANWLMTGIADGITTLDIGASYTRDHDHNVIAVMFLPPGVSRSSASRVARSVAGAAGATPTR